MATSSAGAASRLGSGVPRAFGRSARRIRQDSQVLLATGLAIPTIIVHLSEPQSTSAAVFALVLLNVVVQALLSVVPRRSRLGKLGEPVARLIFALLFVTVASDLTGSGEFRPLVSLYVPIVAMAAVHGGRETLAIGTLAGVCYLASAVAIGEGVPDAVQRGIVLAWVAMLLAIGARRTVSSLEQALHRLRQTTAIGRRRDRQVAAVDAAGRALAADGPDDDALEQIMDLLDRRLGYTHVSIYLVEGTGLRLGAQRGYADPVTWFDGTRGVIGRTMRNRRAEFVRDTSADPDFIGVAPNLKSEICAPLVVGDELLGIVNVETDERRLDETDLESVLLVADRLASALALARERRMLAERADLFQRLTAFGASVTGSLDPKTVYPAIVDGVRRVVASDNAVLTVLDRATGRYTVRALSAGDQRYVGIEIRPGEGVAGRAIRDRSVVVDERFARERLPAGAADAAIPETIAAIAVPFVRDGVVVGALTVLRNDVDKPFSQIEREVLELLAGQIGLAVTNTFLHSDVTEASIRDALTGLYNRRYLDASIDRLVAARRRLDADRRPPTAAILFDLDDFGEFNKRHGHRVGDMILRSFGQLLRDRFRAADLVARYGGEEFVAVLEGATLEDAVRIANELRIAWSERIFPGADGQGLRATVSAGCARLDDDAETADGMLAAADVGLVMAKHAGRNLVVAA